MLQAKLPTISFLSNRNISSDPTCPLCRQAPKDIEHIFFHYATASHIWKHFNSPLLPHFTPNWVKALCLPRTSPPNTVPLHIIVPIIFWNIQINCNHNIFNHIHAPINVHTIYNQTSQFYYLANTSNHQHTLTTRIPIKWHPPHQDCYKLNIDGAFDNCFYRGGAARVFRDASGTSVYGFTKHLIHTNILEAELLDLYHSLILANARHFRLL